MVGSVEEEIWDWKCVRSWWVRVVLPLEGRPERRINCGEGKSQKNIS